MSKHEPADLERLSYQDLTNLAVEAPNTPMHVGALGVLDGRALLDADQRLRIDAIRESIEARLHLVPELRRTLWKTGPFQGRPLWVDDPGFRIENHVRRVELRPPGGEEQALRFAERLMGRLMDRDHPLWQLWFIGGYGPGQVGVFLKLHHVLADGAAVLKIVSLLFDAGPAAPLPTLVAWSPAMPPGAALLYRDNAARKIATLVRAGRRLRHPIALARSAALSMRAVWSMIRAGFGAPRTSINRPISPSRGVAVMRIGLEESRNVAHAGGVKINDLVLNLIAGGLREVLVSRGENVDGVSIRASMAVNMRAGERSAAVGNYSGNVIVRLPVHVRDAHVRLAAIGDATRRAKQKQQGSVPQVFMVLLALSGLTRFFIRRQHLVNILVTNLAGPRQPLFLAGARLLDTFAITPVAGNVTASFAALSYCGRLDLSVHVDSGCWPDLDVLMLGMRGAWLEMSERAATPGDLARAGPELAGLKDPSAIKVAVSS